MARKELLTLAWLLTISAAARAAETDELHRPDRLTAGVADQLLGQMSPDGKTLFFISTRNTTHELFSQGTSGGHSGLVFDERADVTWPRVSPDGKAMLYVSYRDHADGRLCVRNLPGAEGRRCLDDEYPALQGEWIDRSRIALLVRTTLAGDLELREVTVGSRLTARTIVTRNMTTPAVSPDGRWVVYVPLERFGPQIGAAFAAHAGTRLEATNLARPGETIPITVDLPGTTGQPAFSRDGKFLYFVQFFSDTNHDGVIDADDHGILFRMPMELSAGVKAGEPEELSDASWNCQYPAPTPTELIATCAHGHNVDLYTLALDGEVPAQWDAKRLAAELLISPSRADQQLLFHRMLARVSTPVARRLVMANLVRLHLALDEFHAAAFYAEHIQRIADPDSPGMSRTLLTLVGHRRDSRDRERGRMSDDFAEQEKKRLEDLTEKPGDGPAAVALAHIVKSEIADGSGDKARARSELEAVTIDEHTPRTVIFFYYERADALYRELDDKDALVATCRRLAEAKALPPENQLEYARAAVRAMVRGLRYDEAGAALVRARQSVADDSEMAFAIELGRILLGIRGDTPNSVRDEVMALYVKQKRADRRHVVVLDALERASHGGADRVIEALALRYIRDTPPATDEHRRAERLFRRAIVSRAERRAARGYTKEARADFDDVAKQTGSLEAVTGSMELRIDAGEPLAAVRATYDVPRAYPERVRTYVRAYVTARELPTLEGKALEAASTVAENTLRSLWSELRNQAAARSLMAAVLQERFLRNGDFSLAEKANVHDLVALDLSRQNPRYQAMVLGNLALLQEQAGNYRIALQYFDQRNLFPWLADVRSLGVHLAHARSLLHVGREDEAATMMDAVLAVVEQTPTLREYRPLVLDRAALYNLAAGRFERALALYDVLLPIVDAPPRTGDEAKRNPFVLRLARAAAALGAKKADRVLVDLAAVDGMLDHDKALPRAIVWPHSGPDVLSSYRVIIDGLRAHAYGELGQMDAQTHAMQSNRAVLLDRLTRLGRSDSARALSLVESRLAEASVQMHDMKSAASWMTAAAAHADTAHAASNEMTDRPELDITWLAAEVAAVGVGQPSKADVLGRIERDRKELAGDRSTTARTYQRWFDIYSVLLK